MQIPWLAYKTDVRLDRFVVKSLLEWFKILEGLELTA